MKHYFLLALAIVALLITGCKKNDSTDPTDSKSSENTEYEYTVRIYVTPDMIQYLNNEVYLKLPDQDEVKLDLGSAMELNETIDQLAIYALTNSGYTTDDFRVYGIVTKAKRGEGYVRWNLSLQDGANLPEKINMVQGCLVKPNIPNSVVAESEFIASKGVKSENVENKISTINSQNVTFSF